MTFDSISSFAFVRFFFTDVYGTELEDIENAGFIDYSGVAYPGRFGTTDFNFIAGTHQIYRCINGQLILFRQITGRVSRHKGINPLLKIHRGILGERGQGRAYDQDRGKSARAIRKKVDFVTIIEMVPWGSWG
jgi:hypothetical protein